MIEEQNKESFVARIWLERDDNGDSTWRGHIRHVQSEKERYFGDLQALSKFLGQVSGVAGLPMTNEAGWDGGNPLGDGGRRKE